jgi:hypothetical protein
MTVLWDKLWDKSSSFKKLIAVYETNAQWNGPKYLSNA